MLLQNSATKKETFPIQTAFVGTPHPLLTAPIFLWSSTSPSPSPLQQLCFSRTPTGLCQELQCLQLGASSKLPTFSLPRLPLKPFSSFHSWPLQAFFGCLSFFKLQPPQEAPGQGLLSHHWLLLGPLGGHQGHPQDPQAHLSLSFFFGFFCSFSFSFFFTSLCRLLLPIPHVLIFYKFCFEPHAAELHMQQSCILLHCQLTPFPFLQMLLQQAATFFKTRKLIGPGSLLQAPWCFTRNFQHFPSFTQSCLHLQ